ncbi:MAG TPA: hypothetical protein VFP42_14450 [Acidimicrobiia bacterium]|nr:hypothetical protein [Acidimicrobiia bacterium]
MFTSLVLLGPRFAILVWGLIQPARWEAAFSTFVWPLLGFLFLPWTTLMYVAVSPLGVSGFDWFWLVIGFIIDIASYSGSAWGNRERISSYRSPTPA